MARHVIAPTREIPPGARRRVVLSGRPVVVFNLSGAYFALLDRCPHQGASLCAGLLTGMARSDGPGDYRMERMGEVIRCPWHGWEFDIRTGASAFDPDHHKVRRFLADVASGREVAEDLPRAETFEVSIEEEYVVVHA